MKNWIKKSMFIGIVMLMANLFFAGTAFAQTYYYDGTGNLNAVGNWGQNTNGTGTAPTNFTANNQIFNVRNVAAVSNAGTWTVSGTNSKIVVGDGTNATNLTIPTGANTIVGTIDVSAAATLTLTNTTIPTLGTLNATSTVVYNGTAGQNISQVTYGNLTYSGTNTGTFAGSGTYTIAGNFLCTSGSVTFNSSNAARTFNITGNFTSSTTGNIEFGAGNGSGTVNLSGNFSKTNGVMTTTTAALNVVFNMIGSSQTMQSTSTGTLLKWVNFTIANGSTTTLVGDFNETGSAGTTGLISVSSGGILVTGTANIIGANSTFSLASGGTLQIGSTAGITTTGATGNIQTATRTFNAGGNYTYNGTGNQNTGTGLPNNLTGNLTINNPGNTVTLSSAKTIANGGDIFLTAGIFAAGTNLTMASTSTINRSEGSMTGTPQGAGAYNVVYTGNSKTTGSELFGTGLNNVTVTVTSGQTVTSTTTSFSAAGNLLVSTGNLSLEATNANYNVTGNVTVSATCTLLHKVSWDGTGRLFSIGGNLSIAGAYDYSAVPRTHISMTGSGKTISTGSSAVSILTLATAGAITAAGAVTVNDNFWAMFNITGGSFSTNGQTVIANAALLNAGGTVNVNGGSLTITGGLLIGQPGATNGTVNISSGTLTTDGVTLGDAAGTLANTITQTGGTFTINGNVTINQPAANNITNNWNINAQSATVSGLITFAGANITANRVGRIVITTGTLNANGGISFTGSAAATKVIDMSAGAGTLNLKGALTIPAASSTLTAGTSGSIFNYADNVSAQTVNFFNSGAYHNLHINTTGGAGATLSAAISGTNVTGNLRVQSGTLNNGGFAIVGNAARTFEVANATFFQLAGTTSAFPTVFGTISLGATSTVDYRGSGAQTISAQNYGNLSTTLNGTRTITLANSGTIAIRGVFNPAAGTTSYVNTSSTVSFTGSTGSQNIPAFSFNNLTINNTAGVVLTGNVSVNGTTNALTFTNGKITTSSNTITLASGVTVSGAGAGKYVFGNQAWVIPTGTPTRAFIIGDASNYTPATLVFTTSITTGGTITASTTAGDHPNIATSGLDASKSVNRYWTLANSGVDPVGYSATFDFIGPTPGLGDIDAGATTANFVIKRYTGSWSATTAGTALATSTQATAIDAFGDFQIAEAAACVAPTIDAPVITDVTCNGGNDGAISITTTGGTSPFTYLWSNGATTQNVTGLVAGDYTVTITATGGCSVTSGTITVAEPLVLNANLGSTDATCGNTDATISITSPTGGSGSYEYTINGGTNWLPSGNFTGLAAGNYNVQIRDAANPACIVILDLALVINQASVPDAPTSGGNQTICYNGDEEQTITATATSPNAITWYDASSGGAVVAPPSLTGVGTVTYYAEASNGACVSATRTAVILTIQDAPIAPVSGGDETVCYNGDPFQTLIATASSPDAIIWYDNASGGSVVSPPALIGVGTVTYYAEAFNGTCPSPGRTPVTLTINPVLATPGAITGPLDVCPLVGSPTPSTYSIDPVPGATSYTWTVPVGTTIISGQGTTSIDVTFDNGFAQTNQFFRVTAESPSACTSAASSLEVLKNIPGIPLVINGPTDACPFIGQPTNAVYSIDPVAFATAYTWTVSGAATIVSGQGSLSIEVSYLAGFTTGSVRVTANSNCGNRSPRTLGISKVAPLSPAVINGPTDACSFIGTPTQVTYSIDPVLNATSYTWTVPGNVTLVSGQGTTSIQVTFNTGYTTSLIKVRSISNCATSGDRSLSVVAAVASTPGNINGPTNACVYIGTPNNATYFIQPVAGATSYNWSVPTGATIVSHPAGLGVNDTIITVSFNNSFVSGTNISVQAVACISGAARTLAVLRTLAATPGIITGATNVCPFMVSGSNPSGTPVLYTIRKVANTNSYNWTAPAGSSITAHPAGTGVNDTTIEITYTAGFVSGAVTVAAVNDCGTGGVRSLSVTRLTPGTPGAITVVNTVACPNRQYTYTLPSLPSNTTSILWTVPPTATILSGQGSTSITVSYTGAAATGTVTATAYNNCANSGTRSINISLPACVGGKLAGKSVSVPVTTETVSEKMKVNVFPNPTVSDFRLQVLTAGKEVINVRILDMQGREFKKITVMPYQTITVGAELKAGSYIIEVTQGNSRSTQKLIKF